MNRFTKMTDEQVNASGMILIHQELVKVRHELESCQRRLCQARVMVEDNMEEVTGKGYKLKFNMDQTRRLWNLLSGEDPESLAEPA